MVGNHAKLSLGKLLRRSDELPLFRIGVKLGGTRGDNYPGASSSQLQYLVDVIVVASLTAINVSLALLDASAEKSDALGALLAVARGETTNQVENKAMRDKAYDSASRTALSRSVSE